MAVSLRNATVTDAVTIAKVHVDCWRTTYDGMVSAKYLERLSYERSTRNWQNQLADSKSGRFVIVAVDDIMGVVGFAAAGPALEQSAENGFAGELSAIYILESYQRQGIGTRLLGQVVQEFTDRGLDSMVIWVLKTNQRSQRFYEKLGGHLVGEKALTIGGASHTVVAYGWTDLKYFSGIPGNL